MRGNRSYLYRVSGRVRSIPARAGEPAKIDSSLRNIWVYPRACGGTRLLRFGQLVIRRSIPARAGEPVTVAVPASSSTVYPRACGGTPPLKVPRTSWYGLSPRVRGNRREHGQRRIGLRSIPARAGEPKLHYSYQLLSGVYPRACGGTTKPGESSGGRSGLSPRVRGNHSVHLDDFNGDRSIPARAGEPRSPRPSAHHLAVYPRACGGTHRVGFLLGGVAGLSPRVRGNRCSPAQRAGGIGSIPARAGEPFQQGLSPTLKPVYPRACGGTLRHRRDNGEMAGLSPRVRGNRRVGRDDDVVSRSIPARAGEPLWQSGQIHGMRVYPRACGGTLLRSSWYRPRRGLSPRVRGNRVRPIRCPRLTWSIPARAGEPAARCRTGAALRVYPRACGGTWST